MSHPQPLDRWADRVREVRQLRVGDLALPAHGFLRAAEEVFAQAEALLAHAGKTRVLRAYASPRLGGRLTLLEPDAELLRTLHPDERWHVAVLDLTDAEADLLRPAEYALWRSLELDPAQLQALLAETTSDDADLQALLTGLATLADLPVGASDPADPAGGGDGFDPTPAAAGPTRTALGDLWQLGDRHLLAVGDCRDAARVQALIAGRRARCLWTDPPYGVDYAGKTPEALTIAGDAAAGVEALLAGAFAAAQSEALAAGAALYVCHPAGALSVTFGQRFLAAGWRLHQTLIWVKDTLVIGHSDYHYQHEPILFGYAPGPGRWGRGHQGWRGDNAQASVLFVPRPTASRDHPTEEPVALVAAMLANSLGPGEIVYDPFAGSGPVLTVAHRLGACARMVELDPRYADVILRRAEAEGLTVAQLAGPMVTPEWTPPPPPAGAAGDPAAEGG